MSKKNKSTWSKRHDVENIAFHIQNLLEYSLSGMQVKTALTLREVKKSNSVMVSSMANMETVATFVQWTSLASMSAFPEMSNLSVFRRNGPWICYQCNTQKERSAPPPPAPIFSNKYDEVFFCRP